MQTIFLILTAATVGVVAKKRGRNPWAWGIVAAVAFVVVDTGAALALMAVLWDAVDDMSNASVIFFIVLQKSAIFGAFVAVFNAKLKHTDALSAGHSPIHTDDHHQKEAKTEGGDGITTGILEEHDDVSTAATDTPAPTEIGRMKEFKCPSCGQEWASNYCPQCCHTIDHPAEARTADVSQTLAEPTSSHMGNVLRAYCVGGTSATPPQRASSFSASGNTDCPPPATQVRPPPAVSAPDTTNPLYGVHGWLEFYIVLSLYVAPLIWGLGLVPHYS